MSKPFLRPFESTHVIDGKLVRSRAYVVVDGDGETVLAGPTTDEQEARALLVDAESRSKVTAWAKEAHPEAKDRAIKAKVSTVMAYLEWLSAPSLDDPAQETPGTPGEDESVMDANEEF